MKFSMYTFKAMTLLSWPYFKNSNSCLSNKTTTICGHPTGYLRSVPIRHNRRGIFTEIKVRFAPPTMCRRTIIADLTHFYNGIYNSHVVTPNLATEGGCLHGYTSFVYGCCYGRCGLSPHLQMVRQ